MYPGQPITRRYPQINDALCSAPQWPPPLARKKMAASQISSSDASPDSSFVRNDARYAQNWPHNSPNVRLPNLFSLLPSIAANLAILVKSAAIATSPPPHLLDFPSPNSPPPLKTCS